jgi:hypothetical protein
MIFINASLKFGLRRPYVLYDGGTEMLRLSAYVLAALAMVSFFAMTVDVQAGNSQQRRAYKHQTHGKYQKHRDFRMRSINADSRHNGGQRLDNGRKRFNRSTLSFRFADRDHRHRYDRYHHNDRHRHRNRVRVNTGAVVVINVVGDRGYRMPINGARDANTYSGNVDVYSVPGVGTYSYGDSIYSGVGPDATTSVSTSSVKIIDVGDIKPNNGCEMQAGVCVIRP